MEPSQLVEKLGKAYEAVSKTYDVAADERALQAKIKEVEAGKGTLALYEEIGRLESKVREFRGFLTRIENARDFLAYAMELEEVQSIRSGQEEAEPLVHEARGYVLAQTFNGKHDAAPSLLTIHRGVGGEQLEPFMYALATAYARFANRTHLGVQEMDTADTSAMTMRVGGSHAYAWFRGEEGLHRVIIEAMDGKRQTGYVSVSVEPILPAAKVVIKDEDIRVDPLGASTPGGQNANRSFTGVRLTHVPTGITAVSRMRSQLQNIKSAREVLQSRVEMEYERRQSGDQEARVPMARGGHHFRTYSLTGKQFIADHRSSIRMEDPTPFFSGHIEPFIYGFYKMDLF